MTTQTLQRDLLADGGGGIPLRFELKMQMQSCSEYYDIKWIKVPAYKPVSYPTIDDFDKYKVIGNTETPST